MKIALDWIAQYLVNGENGERPLQPKEAADALMNGGLPVESIETFPEGVSDSATPATSVLDVEVTSNRTDCFCHTGLARELAALLGKKFVPPAIALSESTIPVEKLASVTIEDAAKGDKGCSYYSARVIQNVAVGPSPAWLKRRLESVGLRSVNNVVDVTNFVMMELGQPLHAFDYGKLEGRRIVVRKAAAGETITDIAGRTHTLDGRMLVIADAARPVALAGLIGSRDSEVTEKTTTVLLESARFDPLVVRTMARALKIDSDAAFRFMRGVDPVATERASQRAAQLIAQVASSFLGTHAARGVVAAGEKPPAPLGITLRIGRIKQVLGIEVPVETTLAILESLGFDPDRHIDNILTTVPSYRLDVSREIDLIEEIIRVYGYRHLPVHTVVTHPVRPKPVAEKAIETLRRAVLACSFNEAVTVSFVDEAEAKLFNPPGRQTVRVSDAVRGANAVLRPSLFPSLLNVRRINQNAGEADARVFETGEVFGQAGDPMTTAPGSRRSLALVGNSVAEVKGVVEQIVRRLNPNARADVTPQDFPWFAPGAAGAVNLTLPHGHTPLGSVGQFSAAVQKQYDLRHQAAGVELDLEPLLASFLPVRTGKPLPRTQSVARDLSVVVDDAVRWSEVNAAILSAGLPLLEAVDFVTVFRNKQIGEGKKSLTLTLTFRDPDSTLKAEQVDEQVKTALALLTQKFSAALRA